MANTETDYVQALRTLTLPPDSPQTEALHPDERRAAAKARPWISGPNVVGTGVSWKNVSGDNTSELALRVYVKRKAPQRRVGKSRRIPSQVRFPGLSEPLLTDVISIGQVFPELLITKMRPLVPGYSVGLLSIATGTLGCFVAKTGKPTEAMILSNSHVLAETGVAKPGESVVQPGTDDGGGSGDIVGVLTESIPFDFTAGFNNLCDAAIATLDAKVAVSNSVPVIGVPKPPSPAASVAVGDQVQKTGRTTGHTVGIVQDIHFQTTMFYPEPDGGSGNAGFHEQVLCSKYSDNGDSGSLVCDMTGTAIGLHWAGSTASSIFSPIQFVFQQLDIQLWMG